MQNQTALSDKRTAILEAALDLIAANGFHGAPTSAIAARAGVGVGSIYRYFKDKEELIHEVFNGLTEKTEAEILKGYDSNAPFREQYFCLCGNFFRYIYEHPKLFAFAEQYFNSPYGIQRKRSLIGKEAAGEKGGHPLGAFFVRARKEQVIKDLPQQVIGALTIGPIMFMMRDIHNELLVYSEDLVRQVVETTWEAIRR
jgi:AcrR family transcriptional regulator